MAILLLAWIPTSASSGELADWLPVHISSEEIDALCQVQAIIQYRNGRFTSNGMGTPISESELRTAAHVVAGAAIGDEVLVAPCGRLGEAIEWSRARITSIDEKMDTGIVRLATNRMPPSRIPAPCRSRPKPNSQVAALKAWTNGVTIESHVVDHAIVTVLETMPPLRNEIDRTLEPDTYSLAAQSGQLRLVAAGTATPGASGGALWDTQRHCVAGVTSAGIKFEFLAEREKTLRQAGDPPFTSFLVGAPVLAQ